MAYEYSSYIVNEGAHNHKPAQSVINSFPASGNFCRLLINFVNSLDPDQAQQNVGPDLDPNCLTLWWYSWKIFLLI